MNKEILEIDWNQEARPMSGYIKIRKYYEDGGYWPVAHLDGSLSPKLVRNIARAIGRSLKIEKIRDV